MIRAATALRIAAASTPATVNRATFVTTFVAAPLLQAALLAGVMLTAGVPDVLVGAYAAVLASSAVAAMSGVCGSVARDRFAGVIALDPERLLRYPWFWVSRVLLAGGAASATGVVAVGALMVADPDRSLVRFGFLAAGVLVACAVGSTLGVALSLVGCALDDPYALPNAVAATWPLGVGVVVPLGLYPVWWRQVSPGVSLVHVVGAMREYLAGGDGGTLARAAVAEGGLAAAYLAIAVLALSWSLRRMRATGRAPASL